MASFIFALVMGFIGGFLPALRAARMSPLAAIRA
jgi:ABC-type antimicrobial peptide transport system permease subunit